MTLPLEYGYLNGLTSPKMLAEALKWYGTKEVPGPGNNPVILQWANVVGGWVKEFYKQDSTPWCALFVAYVAVKTGYPHKGNVLSAAEWLKWGIKVKFASLGDLLIFSRKGGNHVGFCVGETDTHYAVYGANQNDAVNIRWIAKSRCIGIRQTPWRVGKPGNVVPVFLENVGAISTDEA